MQPFLSEPPSSTIGNIAEALCKNCHSPIQDNFCPLCGQSKKVARITFRGILEDFVEQVINLDTGLLRTFKNLTLRPGHMIREYVEGKRQPYLKPLQFYLIMLALYFAVNEWLDINPLEAGTKLSRKMQPSHLNAAQQAMQVQMMQILGKYFKLMLTMLMFAQALALRLLYRKSGFYLSEMLVVAMFLAGYHYLFSLFTSLGMAVWRNQPNYWPIQAVGFVAVTTYSTWAITQFFRRKGIKAVLQSFSAVMVATLMYGLLSVVVGISIGIYYMMKRG